MNKLKRSATTGTTTLSVHFLIIFDADDSTIIETKMKE